MRAIILIFFLSCVGQIDATNLEALTIHNHASENIISDHVFKMSQSIDDASKDLILNGITSCEELIRINNLEENASI